MSAGGTGLFAVLTLVAALLVSLFDFQNLLSRKRALVVDPIGAPTSDFTILVPLYGSPSYFGERDRLAHVKERVLVVLDVATPAMQIFMDELEEEGWRVFPCVVPAPSPPKLILAALEADVVPTTYAMRLDADSSVAADLPFAIAAAFAADADLCSVKVHARNRGTNLCTRLQALVYDMAMLARHYRPWLISGAGVVARTTMLREILRRHSLSPIGEDIEMGRVALACRLTIRHLDTIVETDVPETWGALLRQRLNWWAGNFRHSFVNLDRNAIQLPVWSLYNLSILWMTIHLHAWNLLGTILHPRVGLLAVGLALIAVGAFTTVVSNWQVRQRLMLVLPVYQLVQSALIVSIGAVWYLRHVRRSHQLGRYRFGYLRRPLPGFEPAPRPSRARSTLLRRAQGAVAS